MLVAISKIGWITAIILPFEKIHLPFANLKFFACPQYIDIIYLSLLLTFADEKVAIADLSKLGWSRFRRGLCSQDTLLD